MDSQQEVDILMEGVLDKLKNATLKPNNRTIVQLAHLVSYIGTAAYSIMTLARHSNEFSDRGIYTLYHTICMHLGMGELGIIAINELKKRNPEFAADIDKNLDPKTAVKVTITLPGFEPKKIPVYPVSLYRRYSNPNKVRELRVMFASEFLSKAKKYNATQNQIDTMTVLKTYNVMNDKKSLEFARENAAKIEKRYK